MGNMEKIYLAEFISYTNALHDTVSDWDGKGTPSIGKIKYLNLGKHCTLVKESDLEKYRKYGQGYKKITFLGTLLEE